MLTKDRLVISMIATSLSRREGLKKESRKGLIFDPGN
jgi:hypothetical protein